jgi:iron complex transport system substrate-binding protein
MFRIRLAALAAVPIALAGLVAGSAAAGHRTADARLPTRIVVLSPTATEDLFAIGAGKQVIAVDDQSNYPRQAPKTTLSSYKPNAEAIAKYRPDLVVVSSDGGIVGSLKKLGIPVLFEPAAANLAQAYAQIARLGRATGHGAQAATVVASMKRQLARVVASAPARSRGLKVFDELSPDLYSATSQTFIGSIFTLFGLKNIADAGDPTHSGYPQLSAEYVISANPDIVVLSDTKCCGQTPATVASRAGWSNVSAVQHHRVVAVSDDVASRWGPRIVQFAKAVAAAARQS